MNRISTIAGLILLVSYGCFSPEETVAARVGDYELSVDRLTEWLMAWEDRPVEIDFVDQLVQHWIHVSLMAERSVAGDSLLDSATVYEAMWPDVLEFLAADLVYRQFEGDYAFDTASVDSMYVATDGYRVIWHQLHRLPDGGSAEARSAVRAAARAEHAELARGSTWTKLARRGDDGLVKLVRGGNLELFKPGETVRAFDSVAFALAPGELAPLVETGYGYHIVYRPTLTEARGEFIRWTTRDLFARYDSAYGAELIARSAFQLEVTPQEIRDIAETPLRHLDSDQVLATYRGGTFTGGELVRWIQYLPVDMNRALSDATDEHARELVRDMVRRELLRDQVGRSDLQLADSVYVWLERRLGTSIGMVWEKVDISPESLAESGETVAIRQRVARSRIDAYLDAVTGGRTGQARIQPFLAGELRRSGDWEFRRAGVDRAMERARAYREGGR